MLIESEELKRRLEEKANGWSIVSVFSSGVKTGLRLASKIADEMEGADDEEVAFDSVRRTDHGGTNRDGNSDTARLQGQDGNVHPYEGEKGGLFGRK